MSACPIAVAAVTLVSIVGPPRAMSEDFGKLGPPPLVPSVAEAPLLVRVAWTDPADAAPGLAPIAVAEAKAVLGRLGLGLVWRQASTGELARPDEIRVILLNRVAFDPTVHVPVLGATPSEPGALPFVWIHVPSVQSTMGLRSGSPIQLSLPEQWALGVALGRVAAHEIVHTIAPRMPHGTGLMSSRFSRQQLTAVRMPIAPEVALAVRAALRSDTAREREVGLLTTAGGEGGAPGP